MYCIRSCGRRYEVKQGDYQVSRSPPNDADDEGMLRFCKKADDRGDRDTLNERQHRNSSSLSRTPPANEDRCTSACPVEVVSSERG